MPRDNNINVSYVDSDKRGAFGGGRMYVNKTTLSRVSGGKDDANNITTSNLRNVFTIGLAFNIGQKLNEAVGAYTNDRLRQRRVNTGMTFAKYAIGLSINPAIGGAYLIGDMTYRATMYGIDLNKRNREAMYNERLSGINANSGSRYRGDYL
jgi:hypothetical protein